MMQAGSRSWGSAGSRSTTRMPQACPSTRAFPTPGGQARVPHPLGADRMISARALPVLETTIRVTRSQAIWLDALSVPLEEPNSESTLRQMGAIYEVAARVVVVLSSRCAAVIEQIKSGGRLDETALSVLEADEWVTRAWTYQECANSASIFFCAEGATTSITGSELLDAVGHALVDYAEAHNIDAFAVKTHFRRWMPYRTLAEWIMGGVAERTALQVMTAMTLRSTEATVEDRLNAMLGALDPTYAKTHTSTDPGTLFMQASEAKGDYSFIYTSAQRSSHPGRGWQPVPGMLPPILSWHSFGEGQHGQVTADGLDLENMVYAARGALKDTPMAFLRDWLHAEGAQDRGALVHSVLQRLRAAGFSGSGAHVELQQGLFFPYGASPAAACDIVIATGIRWVHGAPALVLVRRDSSTHSFADVGVFVGPIPDAHTAVHIV